MKEWLFEKIIDEKLNNLFGLVILLLLSVVSAVLIAFLGMKGGAMILALVIGAPIAVYTIINNQFGYLLLIVFSTFMGFISRALSVNIPFGVGIDLILVLMFSGIILEQIFSNKEDKGKDFSLTNPISVMMFVWTVYLLLQVFNPAGTPAGWMFGLRNILRVLVAFIIAQRVFKDLKSVNTFVSLFIGVGLVVALYGIYQEFVGLPAFDLKWATATEERINLLFIQGKWRKWSFLSDPAIFGLFMAFGSIVGFILSLGPFGWKRRAFFFSSGFLMLLAMFFSGTRTAYVMLPLAVVIYVLINITKVKTLIFAILSVMMFLVVYFGPFYSKPIVRFRSAFNPTEDASMNLRDFNRQRIQPYIHSHPIGGGLTTSGVYGERFSPSHPLAGFPPDSGFMKVLLETGWIGLLLMLALYSTVLAVGISNYYKCEDPRIKSYYAAFIASFFALSIALYAKENIEQFPQNLILYGIFVLMYKMQKFDIKKLA
ncbi:O-antigen ligase family protein [Fulvivirga sp.]|uniref:O-antigen ligase family protein n=1 Tax=Fulvivirga sp. TaxID=1931237 RepID=UPI0032EE5BE2